MDLRLKKHLHQNTFHTIWIQYIYFILILYRVKENKPFSVSDLLSNMNALLHFCVLWRIIERTFKQTLLIFMVGVFKTTWFAYWSKWFNVHHIKFLLDFEMSLVITSNYEGQEVWGTRESTHTCREYHMKCAVSVSMVTEPFCRKGSSVIVSNLQFFKQKNLFPEDQWVKAVM